jgi:hypothetical protein
VRVNAQDSEELLHGTVLSHQLITHAHEGPEEGPTDEGGRSTRMWCIGPNNKISVEWCSSDDSIVADSHAANLVAGSKLSSNALDGIFFGEPTPSLEWCCGEFRWDFVMTDGSAPNASSVLTMSILCTSLSFVTANSKADWGPTWSLGPASPDSRTCRTCATSSLAMANKSVGRGVAMAWKGACIAAAGRASSAERGAPGIARRMA